MEIIEEKIKAVYDSLPASEKKAAQYCLKNRDDLFSHPVKELAELSGTTQATWTRFAKDLGFSGLKELKHAFFSDVSTSLSQADSGGPKIAFKDVNQYTSLQSIADNICATSTQAIQTTYRLFDTSTFGDAVNAIVGADQVRIFGVGASNLAAYDLYCKLLRLHYNVAYDKDLHMSLMLASQLSAKDVAIFISDNVKATDIMPVIELANKKGAKTIAITKLGNSSISNMCEYVLFTTSPEIDKKSGVTSARFAQLYLVDALYTAIANKDYENIKQYLQASYDAFHDTGKD